MVNKNNEDYPMTYSYSRSYFEEAKKNYPSIKYFIDLHRDGVSKEVSTAAINDKKYAKLMFFLGLDHDDSNKNKQLVKDLESIIDTVNHQLLKGEKTQVEFFNIFNHLVTEGKQIVISSDRAPKLLNDLDERLTSRFINVPLFK